MTKSNKKAEYEQQDTDSEKASGNIYFLHLAEHVKINCDYTSQNSKYAGRQGERSAQFFFAFQLF